MPATNAVVQRIGGSSTTSRQTVEYLINGGATGITGQLDGTNIITSDGATIPLGTANGEAVVTNYNPGQATAITTTTSGVVEFEYTANATKASAGLVEGRAYRVETVLDNTGSVVATTWTDATTLTQLSAAQVANIDVENDLTLKETALGSVESVNTLFDESSGTLNAASGLDEIRIPANTIVGIEVSLTGGSCRVRCNSSTPSMTDLDVSTRPTWIPNNPGGRVFNHSFDIIPGDICQGVITEVRIIN